MADSEFIKVGVVPPLFEKFCEELRPILCDGDPKYAFNVPEVFNQFETLEYLLVRCSKQKLDIPMDFDDEHDLFTQVYNNLRRTGRLEHFRSELQALIYPSKPYTPVILNYQNIPQDEPEFTPPCFKSGDNLTNSNISPKVNLSLEKDGHHYFANKDIKEGEEIIIEKPAFICNSTNYDKYKNDCYKCSKTITTMYTCFSCYRVLFCSKECAQTCIEKSHRYECKAVQHDFFKNEGESLLALKMLFTKIDSCPSYLNLGIEISEEELETINLPSVLENASPTFLEMALKKTIFLCLYLETCTNFFTIMGLKKIHDVNSKHYNYALVGGYLLKYICLAAKYSLLFPNDALTIFPGAKGMHFSKPSITLSLTQIKHNCRPNAIVVTKRNYSIVRAGQHIKKGDEITISRIGMGFTTTQYDIRRKLFKKLLTCDCSNCTMALVTEYENIIYKCPDCKGKLMRFWPKWKCYDCKKSHNPDELELTRKQFITDGETLIRDKKTAEEMVLWFGSYLQFHYSGSEKLFEVALSLLSYYLENDGAKMARSILVHLFVELNRAIHRYSYNKLNIVVSMLYVLYSYIWNTENPSYYLLDMLDVIDGAFKSVSTFLCMDEEYSQLVDLKQKFQNCFIKIETKRKCKHRKSKKI